MTGVQTCALPIFKTNKARAKIRQWLVNDGQVLAIDKNVVARKREDQEPKASERRFEPESSRSVWAAPPQSIVDYRPFLPNQSTDSDKAGLSVAGAGNLMVRFAGCCKPSAGDRIVGYVSRGRGIIVHRQDCKNLPGISEFDQRRVEVSWELSSGLVRHYRVWARKSSDLFSEIENAAKKNGGRLVEGRLEADGDGYAGSFTMAFAKVEDARVVERNLKNVPSIQKIRRTE